jgi:hypothetical protein
MHAIPPSSNSPACLCALPSSDRYAFVLFALGTVLLVIGSCLYAGVIWAHVRQPRIVDQQCTMLSHSHARHLLFSSFKRENPQCVNVLSIVVWKLSHCLLLGICCSLRDECQISFASLIDSLLS